MKRVHSPESVRVWIARFAVASIAASAMLVVATSVAVAQTQEITIGPGEPVETIEGNQVADQVVAVFTDNGLETAARPSTGSTQQATTCDSSARQRYQVAVDWLGDGTYTSEGVTVSCGDGFFVITGTYTYKDSGEFTISASVKDSADDQSASGHSDVAAISDREISAGSARNVTGTEGTTLNVSATFADSNHAYSASGKVDPGLTATIDWGDGSTSAGTVSWNDDTTQNVVVTSSHGYDANVPATKAYNVKVTVKDDGSAEAQATDTLTATIADAGLTAGTAPTLTTSPTKAFTSAVGTFTDAAQAQAQASDFTATITWGDNSSSAGTVSQTSSGAFSVSGGHTYASGGAKSITATVTDEEGSTVTLHATANVVVLPTTGGPHKPAAPSWPVLALALLLFLGISAVVGGLDMNRLDKIRR